MSETELPPPANVIAALAGVLSELGGIEKLNAVQRKQRGMHTAADGERGVPYAYRGIDQIAAKVQPLLGTYGVVIVPTEVQTEVQTVEVGGKPWTSERHRVRWTIYGPGGPADSITAESVGEGRDNSDKAANKASTMAYKNLLLRLFSIGDPADDADHERAETSSSAEPKITEEQKASIRAVINEMPTEASRAALRSLVAQKWGKPDDILARDGAEVAAFVSATLRDALMANAPALSIPATGQPSGSPATGGGGTVEEKPTEADEVTRVVHDLGDAVKSVEKVEPPAETPTPPPPPPGDRPQPAHPGGPGDHARKATARKRSAKKAAAASPPAQALTDAVEEAKP